MNFNQIKAIANGLKEATTEELCEIMDSIPYELNEQLLCLLDLRINSCDDWTETLKEYEEM